MNVPGKSKRYRMGQASAPDWKKAIVTLTKSGHKIELIEGMWMGIKQYKPTSPGRRGMTGYTFDEITKKRPEKSLLAPLKSKAGRSNQGRITVRHRGGGAKRRLRIIDFKRDKTGVPGRVAAIEYDPNRTARIALIFYRDGDKRYILAPVGLKVERHDRGGPQRRDPPGQRPAPAEHTRRAPPSITSSCSPAAAAR